MCWDTLALHLTDPSNLCPLLSFLVLFHIVNILLDILCVFWLIFSFNKSDSAGICCAVCFYFERSWLF